MDGREEIEEEKWCLQCIESHGTLHILYVTTCIYTV